MSDPRMITADETKVSASQARLLMSVIDPHQPPTRKDWDDHLVYRLATTVECQSAQIERVRKALHRIEQADEKAQHEWDTNADTYSQGAAMGYSMAAQWIEEALGDTDDAANHAGARE